MSNHQKAKDAAGKAAAELVKDGMLVGLGTGSTAACLIQHLIERCRQGLKIQAVATSIKSQQLAQAGGIPFVNINDVIKLDLTIDGADEIDPQKSMIKGGGGALLREKIVATMSNEMIVIIDESKLVTKLGATMPLPIEIVPFAHMVTARKLEDFGFFGKFRLLANGQPWLTDNGNYILDITLPKQDFNPEHANLLIRSVPGVVETGLFINIAGRVVVGYQDGKVEIRP
jgi:ribose 5-phosphate isomerase A